MKLRLALLAAIALWIAPACADVVNPGALTLGDFQIGAAGQQTGAVVLTLQGLTGLSCQARFFFGSGGSTANIFIQTTLDQGQTWFDIANIGFTNASAIELINLSGLTGVTTPTAPVNLALPNNTTLNGPMGDQLRAVEVSTGTYGSNTLASVRCVAR